MSAKPVKLAVFAVVENPEGKILAVKRPESDEDLPGLWGLPATSAEKDEGITEAFSRIGHEKLGVQLQINEFIGRSSVEREDYILVGEEYYCSISDAPEVPQEGKPGTQYTEWKWANPEILREAAKEGSLCCQIFLDSRGIDY